MKVRNGFVSNSSSSSFVCSICGCEETGYDGQYDFAVTTCDHCDHEYCSKHFDTPSYIGDGYDECPMCQLKAVWVEDEVKYLRMKLGMTEQEVHDEIRDTCGTLKQLRENIKFVLDGRTLGENQE